MGTSQTTRRTLDSLKLGETAVIAGLHVTGAARRRLMDLGILVGTQITAELVSPLADPVAYRIRGTLVALRRTQAKQIRISSEGG